MGLHRAALELFPDRPSLWPDRRPVFLGLSHGKASDRRYDQGGRTPSFWHTQSQGVLRISSQGMSPRRSGLYRRKEADDIPLGGQLWHQEPVLALRLPGHGTLGTYSSSGLSALSDPKQQHPTWGATPGSFFPGTQDSQSPQPHELPLSDGQTADLPASHSGPHAC